MSAGYFHAFDVGEAKRFGIEGAIVIQTLRLWILKNRNDGEADRYRFDGKWWCTVTPDGWKKGLPYFSYQKIWRIIDKLCALGVLEKGNHAPNQWSRQLWFAFADDTFLPPDETVYEEEDESEEDAQEQENEPENTPDNVAVTDEITHFSEMKKGTDDESRNLHKNDVSAEIVHFTDSETAFFKNEKSIFQNCKMNNKEVIYVSNILKEKKEKEKKEKKDQILAVLCRAMDARTSGEYLERIGCFQYSDCIIIASADATPLERLRQLFEGRYETHNGLPLYYVVFTDDERAIGA